MARSLADEMRCPTCGARQGWSETCRRCKCDLRLLVAAARAYERHRRRCLELLNDGMHEAALGHARRCRVLRPGEEAWRLSALCELYRQNWPGAWRAATIALELREGPGSERATGTGV